MTFSFKKIGSFCSQVEKSWPVQSVFFVLKIAIYLVVLYSVLFTLTLTYGGYKAYLGYQEFMSHVQNLQTNPPKYSAYMKRVATELNIPTDSLKFRFVPKDSISSHIKAAVIAGEDDAFWIHPGINITSILEAMETNKRRGKVSMGGSTLTQQLAKNLFLDNERSWVRKGKELVYTLLLEKYLGKDHILEFYLNYAQWGKDIFGCEAASQFYFKKSCYMINRDQAVALASVLPNPVRWSPLDKRSRFLSVRKNMIYHNMWYKKEIAMDQFMTLTGDTPRSIRDSLRNQALIEDSTQAEMIGLDEMELPQNISNEETPQEE